MGLLCEARAWIDRAAAWVRQHTTGVSAQFASSRSAYDSSEGIFRIVGMISVLQRGMGVVTRAEWVYATSGSVMAIFLRRKAW